ncbi:MAG: heme lyase CcmF/NrfE family subunit [Deltaproteobacteria bacterium]|nr:heme lyase CcmF/NrfE family subunit [Deltaproteobacteria bacterium]
MLADLGFYLLLLCLVSTCYGVVAAVLAALWRHRRLYRSSRLALTASCTMASVAALMLWYLFFNRDYSVAYIFKTSSNDLPQIYTLTAFWSSLEGSHFLWTLLLCIYGTIALWTYSKDNEHIMPYVSASIQAVLGWMFYLLLSHSDPFLRLFPARPDGQGMNTLLQNPYMAIHPPTLFTGYTALAIPAAYSVAALCYGDITEGWLKTTRRWTLYAWCALTAGIILGGHWAYVELGWSGYWAWDPVENSSFIPWLFCTSLLHSLVVQDKLGHLKRLTIILAFLAFFFSFFGTFITRSGVISSVHSFAESPIGPNYLAFLAAMLLAVAVIYGFRAPSILPPEADKAWGVSKESALVITQFLLLTLAAIVCVGTLYPIVSEAITGERTTVQAPYFNAFAPWIGLGLVVAIALGNLMRYQTNKMPGGPRLMIGAAVVALPLTAVLVIGGDVMSTKKPFNLAAQVVGLFLCAWSTVSLTGDLVQRLRDIRFKLGLFLSRNLAYVGGYIAHIGLLIAIAGFLGNYRGLQKIATLNSGETVDFYGYQLRFDEIKELQKDNATLYQGALEVTRAGAPIGAITPARSRYPTSTNLNHEVALMSTFWHDLYVTLSDFDRENGRKATFELHINPTVRFVWIAAFVMVIGGIIAMFDRYRGNKSRDAIRAAL